MFNILTLYTRDAILERARVIFEYTEEDSQMRFKQINGVPKREIPDALFVMVEEANATTSRSKVMFQIFVAMMIFIGIFLLYIQLPRMPEGATSEEAEFNNDVIVPDDFEPFPPPKPSDKEEPTREKSQRSAIDRKKIAHAVLTHLDYAWAEAKIP